MSDLISRSALEKYMRDYKWEFALNSDFSKAIEMVDVQPTIEAVPVVHGEWKFCNISTSYLEPPSGDTCECSVCGFIIDVSETNYNFCPNCGAKMEE